MKTTAEKYERLLQRNDEDAMCLFEAEGATDTIDDDGNVVVIFDDESHLKLDDQGGWVVTRA